MNTRLNRFVFWFLSILLFTPSSVGANPFSFFDEYRGAQNYEKKEYEKAKKYFTDRLVESPNDLNAAYNLGNAFYRLQEFPKAVESFSKSAQSSNPNLKAQSLYNLGNSFYRMNQLEKSIEAYEKALKVRPGDKQTQENLDFVKNQLKKQKEQASSQQNSAQNSSPKQENEKEKSANNQKQEPENSSNPEPEPKENKEPNSSPKKLNEKMAEQLLDSVEEKQGEVLKGQIQQKMGRGGFSQKDW